MAATIRIAMLSGPRNISTTIMRSFENRPDTVVCDEPFYACYLKASGAQHPMRAEIMASQSADWSDVSAALRARNAAPISFEKHISFHFNLAPSFDWLDGARVFHLIRDPHAMVASYKNKLDDISPIIDSYRLQRQLYEQAPAPVVDASDVLTRPEPVLRNLCKALDIPFSQDMLSWPPGPRDSDGPWAPHWYDAVESSTGFRRFEPRKINLPPGLEDVADACADDYAFFHSRRLGA
ncbi:HAD family hydrolase [Hyphococcus sp.]|uniref:sulfotransferase-like domain-containing protein n=1 Tax=Hyphococcus sp. TaxID=2038636 RepID=UPI002087CCBE|nr:MAG: branched chain amino acid aminotransferase [Marinicaulis sp.]